LGGLLFEDGFGDLGSHGFLLTTFGCEKKKIIIGGRV
jgi:hypothetical protein